MRYTRTIGYGLKRSIAIGLIVAVVVVGVAVVTQSNVDTLVRQIISVAAVILALLIGVILTLSLLFSTFIERHRQG